MSKVDSGSIGSTGLRKRGCREHWGVALVLTLAATALTACGSSSSSSSTKTKGAPARASNAAPVRVANSATPKVKVGSGNDTTRGSWTYEGDFYRSTDGTQHVSEVINLDCRDEAVPDTKGGYYDYYEREQGEDQTIFDHPRVDLTESGGDGSVGMSLLPTDSTTNAVGSRLVTSVKVLLSLNVADYVTVHYRLTLWCVTQYSDAWLIVGHSRRARGSARRG